MKLRFWIQWTLSLMVLQGIAWASSPMAGQVAPPVVLTTLDGKRFELARYKGKVVLVHFWATWCEPCKKQMPLLGQFYAKHRAQGLELVGISMDSKRDRGEVLKRSAEYGFPSAMEIEAITDGLGPARAIPMTYAVDRQGRIAAILQASDGELDEKRLEQITGFAQQ